MSSSKGCKRRRRLAEKHNLLNVPPEKRNVQDLPRGIAEILRPKPQKKASKRRGQGRKKRRDV